MKDKEKVVLTSELYEKISGDNISKMVELKDKKDEIMSIIEEELEVYTELLEERKKLDELIGQTKNNLQQGRIRKYKVNRELSKQKRKAKKINNVYAKGLHINLGKFGIQQSETKKR